MKVLSFVLNPGCARGVASHVSEQGNSNSLQLKSDLEKALWHPSTAWSPIILIFRETVFQN